MFCLPLNNTDISGEIPPHRPGTKIPISCTSFPFKLRDTSHYFKKCLAFNFLQDSYSPQQIYKICNNVNFTCALLNAPGP